MTTEHTAEPTRGEIEELVKDAMFDTANNPLRELKHYDIGREFNLGNVKNELAHRITERLYPLLERQDKKSRIDELKGLPVCDSTIDYEITIEKRIAALKSVQEES